MITAAIASLLVLLGAGFSLIAALGAWRMHDTYTRMHAATKAGPLGAGLLLAGVAVAAGDGGQALRAGAVIAFLVLTGPVAAHLIGRAVHRRSRKLEEVDR
jgi:multicomponent Na+:H+ antiporter subunit G